jgi:hypothetical protein
MSKQIIVGQRNTTASGGTNPTTVLLTGTQGIQSTTRPHLMPVAGTFRNLRIRQATALGIGNTRTYRIRKGAGGGAMVDTALTITFGAADLDLSITGVDVHFAAGDLIDMNVTNTGTNLVILNQSSLEFEPDVDGQILFGTHGQGVASAGYRVNPFMGERFYLEAASGGNASTDYNGSQRNRIAQTLLAMTVNVDTAPGTAKSYYLCWNVNGTDWDGSGGTPDTRAVLSGTSTTASVTIAASPAASLAVGDVVGIVVRFPGAAPTLPNRFSVAFATLPDAAGQYTFHSQGLGSSLASVGVTRYFLPCGGDWLNDIWTGTESDVYQIGSLTEIQVRGLYVELSGALDASTEQLTFSLRINGVDAGSPVVLSGVGAITGSVTFSTIETIGPADTFSLRATNTGSTSISTSILNIRTVLSPGFLTDPTVQTRSATNVKFDSATLRGRVNPNDFGDLDVYFEWGTDPTLATSTSTSPQPISNGTTYVAFTEGLTGLTRGTTYYFRAVADTGGSPLLYGAILSFTTRDEHVFIDGETSHPLTMISFIDRDDNRHVFAEVDLNDDADYEGGYKAPKVVRWLPISRGFSDRTGQIEHMSFGAILSDAGPETATLPRQQRRFFRELLDSPTNRYLTNRPMWEKMIDDEDRRAEQLWRYVANGYVADYEPGSPLQFQITGCDWLKRKFSRRSKTQSNWQPLITVDKFPECKEFNLNKAAPIIYGKLDDVKKQIVQIGTTAGYDGTIRRVTTALAYDESVPGSPAGGPFYGPITVIVVPVVAGVEGPISNAAGTVATNRTVAAYWDHQDTADSYNIYFHDGGWLDWTPHEGVRDGATVTFVRKLTHDNSTIDGGDQNRDFRVELEAITDGSDALTGVATALVDKGHGTVKPLYVGTVDPFSDGPVYALLVARGAVQWIRELYVDGIAQNIETDAGQAGVGGIWYIPGYPNWDAELPDPFIEIGGDRYTVIYGKVGYPGPDKAAGLTPPEFTPGTRPNNVAVGVTVNVWGIEETGDGTGPLIESLALQQAHFLRNFLAGNEPPGTNWRTSCPTFEHEPTLDVIDETSFEDVDALWQTLIPTSPAGCPGKIVIGANGKIENALDVLAKFNVSGDWNGTFTRKGQYAISMEPIEAPADPVQINDIINVVADTFKIRDLVSSEFYNVLPYVHTQDYTGITESGWLSNESGERDVHDDDSIENYEQEREAPTFELAALRGDVPVDSPASQAIAIVMARKLARYRHPLRVAAITVPLSGTSVEVGDIFQLSHIEGIGASGWVDRLVRATRHVLDPNMNRVTIEVYDVEPLLS